MLFLRHSPCPPFHPIHSCIHIVFMSYPTTGNARQENAMRVIGSASQWQRSDAQVSAPVGQRHRTPTRERSPEWKQRGGYVRGAPQRAGGEERCAGGRCAWRCGGCVRRRREWSVCHVRPPGPPALRPAMPRDELQRVMPRQKATKPDDRCCAGRASRAPAKSAFRSR